MKYELRYGEKQLSFYLPEEKVLWDVVPKNIPGADDEEAEIKDMWQADKALACACLLVNPGKTVIWCPPCTEGISPEHPILYELKDTAPEKVLEKCRKGEITDQVGASAHIMIGVMRRMAHIIIVSDGITREQAGEMGFDYADDIQSAIEMAFEREGPDACAGIVPFGTDIAPAVDAD